MPYATSSVPGQSRASTGVAVMIPRPGALAAEPRSQSELCRLTGMDRTTMVSVVDELERHGGYLGVSAGWSRSASV
ncbi:helix-turn-helix domain-containing protein [Spirillospora sp. NPDC047279]|uniref:helix-turn-helix domain-containing protein n=1 Tax=Spirillospora sp. NPDC047279 TaxID=3155478 RepID=UPI0033E4948F